MIISSGKEKKNSLRTGFEPVRVEPNGFQVHLLNRSDTAAVESVFNLYGVELRHRNSKFKYIS